MEVIPEKFIKQSRTLAKAEYVDEWFSKPTYDTLVILNERIHRNIHRYEWAKIEMT